jgi:hypothetical protein
VDHLFKKGQPRPPTAGRKAGTPNKSTVAIREAAQAHGTAALHRLVALIRHRDGHVALKAIQILLAYAYGKPTQYVELGEGDSSHVRYVFHFPDNQRSPSVDPREPT